MGLTPALLSLTILVGYLANPSHGLGTANCPTNWTEAGQYNVPSYFYPFLQGDDTIAGRNDDGSTPEIRLSLSYPLFGFSYSSVWVNTNGIITVMGPYGTFTPRAFPISGRILIAGFWADVDTRTGGLIYYRETTDRDVLCRFSCEIQRLFPNFFNFQATSCFIATWYRVTYFGGSSNTPVNTFQVILCTNGRHTFVQFKYGDITWTTGTSSGGSSSTGLGGTPAQVGFNSGGDYFFAVDESRTSAIVDIDILPSNTGTPGCWAFRTDLENITSGGCNTGGSLLVGPRHARINGGKKIYISGPCFNLTTDVLVVKFNESTVSGVIKNEQEAYCFTPFNSRTGSVKLRVSIDNGITFPFSTTFFFVMTDPENDVTRKIGPEYLWFEQPYTRLAFYWRPSIFPPGVLLDVNVVVYEEDSSAEQGVVSTVVEVMRDIENNGEAELPTNLPYATALDLNASVCAIQIKMAGVSLPSDCAWSDIVVCHRWFNAMLFEELDIRAARGDELSPGETELHAQLVEAIDQLDQPTVESRRKKRIIPLIGAALIRSTLSFTLRRIIQHCILWSAAEVLFPADFSDALTPPCNRSEAECNGEFNVDEACDGTEDTAIGCALFHNGASICYRSATGQQACYDDSGKLITDPYRGGGTLDRVSAEDSVIGHFFADVLPYFTCCFLNPFACDVYFDFRPTQNCDGYMPEPKGFNGGDPHFTTLDGLTYTYNPVGEFCIIKVNESFEIQGRFGFLRDDAGDVLDPDRNPVTVMTAFAFKWGENVFQVEPGPPSQAYLNIYTNDMPDDYMDIPDGTSIEIIAGDRTFTVRRSRPGDIVVLLQVTTGCAVEVRIRKVLSSLLVTFGLSNCFRGNTVCLLGDFDGDANNDFITSSGIILPSNSSQQDIHELFGNTWRLDAESSNMRYPTGMGFNDYNDESFDPEYLDEAELLALTGADFDMCGDNVMCRFDLFYTGSVQFASGTLGAIAEVEEAARIYNLSFSPCHGAPCGPGGVCNEDGDSFQCSCDNNYTGERCGTIIDVCQGIGCQNNGLCRPEASSRNGFLCYCQVGFIGDFCEIPDPGDIFNPCGNSTCANGGTCLAVDVQFTCICEEGYTGRTCEDTDLCALIACENGGSCISNTAICLCLAGYSGATCQNVDPSNPCESRTCFNGGTCFTDGSTYICACRFGFSGLLCQSDVCMPDPCQNGGLCTFLENAPGYVCGCLAGFSGELCEIVDPTNPCGGFPCLNGGTCYSVGSVTSCDCTSGYTGDTCQSVISVCSPNPCENGGMCDIVAAYPGYLCLCPVGYGGTFCQFRDSSNPCQTSPCLNGGTCFADGSSVTCDCIRGYTGELCEDIADSCSPNPCLNGGMCEVDGAQGFQCACPAGYGGYICQNVNPTNPCVNSPCLNGGTCFFDGSRITCGCRFGYTGRLCDSVADQLCSSYPCQNGGTCLNSFDSMGYYCFCPATFAGRNCENVVSGGGCSTRPCENRGLCINVFKDQYRCLCHAGFSGTNCQIESTQTPCSTFPCQNGGLCNYGNGVYFCTCTQGYFGNDCEIDRTGCETRRCISGGTCLSSVSGEIRRCLCEPGYTGQQCETALVCSPNPCENGGTCGVRLNVASCECPDGYYGFYCHISNEQGVQAVIVTVVSYAVFAVVLLTVMAGVLCMVNRRRNVETSSVVNLGPNRMVLRGKF